ncbi:hypothetical protein EYF80_032409 [Liparis tanakae]|uniref:Uncharacterized protein n=1 Tax=Liparis tanakae TaxID=230148 RepID=A0A4Z2GX45_9TELE|nr:hypothetical protein EYF80_032409 [Liparis tanakae]
MMGQPEPVSERSPSGLTLALTFRSNARAHCPVPVAVFRLTSRLQRNRSLLSDLRSAACLGTEDRVLLIRFHSTTPLLLQIQDLD